MFPLARIHVRMFCICLSVKQRDGGGFAGLCCASVDLWTEMCDCVLDLASCSIYFCNILSEDNIVTITFRQRSYRT